MALCWWSASFTADNTERWWHSPPELEWLYSSANIKKEESPWPPHPPDLRQSSCHEICGQDSSQAVQMVVRALNVLMRDCHGDQGVKVRWVAPTQLFRCIKPIHQQCLPTFPIMVQAMEHLNSEHNTSWLQQQSMQCGKDQDTLWKILKSGRGQRERTDS